MSGHMQPKLARDDALTLAAGQRFQASCEATSAFFTAQADAISRACWAMARRFHRGGRLLVFGVGASASDAQHVAVEFVHPVLVGKRALPAMALSSDLASILGPAHAALGDVFRRQIEALGRPADIALGLSAAQGEPSVVHGLEAARDAGLLTLAVFGGDAEAPATGGLDHAFAVPGTDQFVVQEVQETLYHVLWELVHVFFEHEGLLE